MSQQSFSRFLILWAGQLMSGLGNGMTAFALGVYIFQQTGSTSAFALIVLCLYLPSILLRPLGGVLADRLDRRLMIIIGDLGSALGVLFLLLSVFTGHADLWRICLGVTVSSTFTALQSPAYKASVSDLLTQKQYTQAAGMVQLASSAQHLLSPLAAGIIMSTGSLETVLLIDISTFFLAVSAASVIRTTLPKVKKELRNSLLVDLKEGWDAVTEERGVLLVVLIMALVTFFIGFVQTLFGPMMLSFTEAGTLGMVQSISATGMIASSLFLGIFGIRGRKTTLLLSGFAGAGIFLLLVGMTTSIPFITGALFLFFCTLPLINTSADVLIRSRIPNEQQGRAWGIIGVLSQLGYIAAYGISGLLADRLFNPLLLEGGALASSAGKIIGTGPGRGIGLILMLSGMSMVIVTGITSRIKPLRTLDTGLVVQS